MNDIALIKIREPIELNNNIQLACLPPLNTKKYPTKYGITGWLPGWGVSSKYGDIDYTLNNVKITVYTESRCKNVEPLVSKNWNNQICAGYIKLLKKKCLS